VILAPPIAKNYWPLARHSLRALLHGDEGRDRMTDTVAGTLTRFMERVRRASPETAGYFDVRQVPEYGIVAHANLGHALQNVARRPTPADPFWAFIGRENWDRSFRLLGADSEDRAIELAAQLRARYVVTMSSSDPTTLEGWLHHDDGLAARGWPASGHFRLVTEADAGGVPFEGLFRRTGRRTAFDRTTPPYKLFEIVDGASLEARTEPGATVEVELSIESPSGREIQYRATASSDAEGHARLRVPYATDLPPDRVRAFARGPYRLRVADCSVAVPVTDAQVRSGAVIPVAVGTDACPGSAPAS